MVYDIFHTDCLDRVRIILALDQDNWNYFEIFGQSIVSEQWDHLIIEFSFRLNIARRTFFLY